MQRLSKMLSRSARRLLLLIGPLAVAACASQTPMEERTFNPSDPWAAHIAAASDRFDVPENWIREVMWVESRGQTHLNGSLTVSHAGAMGLMQVMPGTWDYLTGRYGLGNNPHDPAMNIMAGTAYIREMYEEFGSPGFLYAYNAGPGRYQQFLEEGRPLPDETIRYVAMIGPRITGRMPNGVRLETPASRASSVVASAPPPVRQPTPVVSRPTTVTTVASRPVVSRPTAATSAPIVSRPTVTATPVASQPASLTLGYPPAQTDALAAYAASAARTPAPAVSTSSGSGQPQLVWTRLEPNGAVPVVPALPARRSNLWDDPVYMTAPGSPVNPPYPTRPPLYPTRSADATTDMVNRIAAGAG
ncbi:MAG: transglycosylase SLT domain-containing protein [Pseudomonadota bacterium]